MHPTAQPTASDDIDIAALLRAISRRKFWIAAFAVAAGVATYVALSFVTPLYSSQARILIEREVNSYKRPADSQIFTERRGNTDQEAVSSQVQVLLSRDLATGVVKDLKLDEDPEFNKEAGNGMLWRRVLRFVRLDNVVSENVAMCPKATLGFVQIISLQFCCIEASYIVLLLVLRYQPGRLAAFN